MKQITFYEKTGCKGNARQKKLLEEHGFELEIKSILDEPWEEQALRSFFGDRPIKDWFNWKAPAVKTAEVDPNTFDEANALKIMMEQPILIRRPLIKYADQCACGFDDLVKSMLDINEAPKNMEACQQKTESCDDRTSDIQ